MTLQKIWQFYLKYKCGILIGALLVLSVLFVDMVETAHHPILRNVEVQPITYKIEGLDYLGETDKAIVMQAVQKSFDMWEAENPGLTFEEGVGGMTIEFTDRMPFVLLNGLTTGFADCPLKNSENDCKILILKSFDARQEFDMLTHTISHEIGHVLGFMHTDDKTHLMYGPCYVVCGHAPKAFTAPPRIPGI